MFGRKLDSVDRPTRIHTISNLQPVQTSPVSNTERNYRREPYSQAFDSVERPQRGLLYRELLTSRPTDAPLQSTLLSSSNQFTDTVAPFEIKNLEPIAIQDDRLPDLNTNNAEINLRKFKIGDFELGMKLGKGKFSSVYLAREKATNYIVALKILNKFEVQRLFGEKLIVREIKIHSYVDHPNIIKLYGFFHDEQNIYLILEYAPEGEVYKELKRSVSSTAGRSVLRGKDGKLHQTDHSSIHLPPGEQYYPQGSQTGEHT